MVQRQGKDSGYSDANEKKRKQISCGLHHVSTTKDVQQTQHSVHPPTVLLNRDKFQGPPFGYVLPDRFEGRHGSPSVVALALVVKLPKLTVSFLLQAQCIVVKR